MEKNLGSGIGAGPVTYQVDGKQYVAIVVGRTAALPAFLGDVGKKMTAPAPEAVRSSCSPSSDHSRADLSEVTRYARLFPHNRCGIG